MMPKECKNGNKCKNTNCTFNHTKKFVWKKKMQDNNKSIMKLLQKTVKPDINLDISNENLSYPLNRSEQYFKQEHHKWIIYRNPEIIRLNKIKKKQLVEQREKRLEKELQKYKREQAKLKNISGEKQ